MTPEDIEARNLRLENAWFNNLPIEVWDGSKPLLLYPTDVLFFSREEIDRFCMTNCFDVSELRLIPCQPVYAASLGAEEFYAQDIDVRGELPPTVLADADVWNETLIEAEPLTYMPEEKRAYLL